MNLKTKNKEMRFGLEIGFDASETYCEGGERGLAAELLIREMARLAPEHEFFLYYSSFGTDAVAKQETAVTDESANPSFRRLASGEALRVWQAVEKGTERLPRTLDIVHANCVRVPQVAPAKLVCTVSDMSFWLLPELNTEENRLLRQEGILSAIRQAAALVFISQTLQVEFERILPGLLEERGIKHTVMSLASRFGAVGQPRSTFADGDWLAVGLLVPRKNYEGILNAFERYCEQSTVKRKLRIAGGKGWNSEALRSRIERLEHRGLIRYEEDVEAERLCELYANAFGLVFPSHYEAFGLPIVEAMSQGCPVITRENSSLSEVGGSAAIYCGDTDLELAEAMLRLERDQSSYVAASEAGWAQANQFTWSAAASRVLELYDAVL
jgi:glycosyl transferase family 1